MKKRHLTSDRTANRKVACTVSAAALMLGVSQAATVGLKFTIDYGLPGYVNYVSGPAFGLPMASWQNLTGMPTGYHGTVGVGDFTFSLNEVVDTTTSTGGLHPLPNGSLTVNWSGAMGNFSGFNGYGGQEAQVYAGFIRDGVNFGPGSSGGNNDQPSYNIDIVGLKSVFTNTPFVIELVAGADSMYHLTNAFIIDATHSVTQSVVYPNTQAYGDVGDTAWYRAIGGGLSTATPDAVNGDHVIVIPSRAQHSAAASGDPKTLSINNGATLSGMIITDKPVITMKPQQKVVGPGDTVVWSAYAIGVPPLSLQWRKNGVPIAGATSTDYSITNVTAAALGNIDLMASNVYGIAISSAVTVDSLQETSGNNYIIDSKPLGTEHDGLNFGAAWVATNSDGTTTRSGAMQFTATSSNQITAPATADFSGITNGTIMFWMRSAGTVPSTGESGNTGDGASLFDDLVGSTGLVFIQSETDGTLSIQSSGSAPTIQVVSASSISDNKWHSVAFTYGQSQGDTLALYIDGVSSAAVGAAASWSWPAGQQIDLGNSRNSIWQKYNGLMDDVRIYNRVLTDTEIAQAAAGAVVDPAALQLRYNFDLPPTSGVTLQWQLQDVILQSADSVNGPFLNLPGAASPYPTAVKPGMKFYRYQGHTPTTIIANPYLM